MDDMTGSTGQNAAYPPLSDRECTEKEFRSQAVFMAKEFYGVCPDLIDKAKDIANFILDGTTPVRGSAEIHTLPKAKVQ